VKPDRTAYGGLTSATKGQSNVDAIVLLKEDHTTVEKLFKQYEKAGKLPLP
jgi:hypothetical protein